jgi:hypothetical protein
MTDMTIKDISDRLKVERRDVTVQTSISESDSEILDQFVEWCAGHGVNTNRSGVLRAMLLEGLEAFKEEAATEGAALKEERRGEEDRKPSPDPGDPGNVRDYFEPRVIRDEPQA